MQVDQFLNDNPQNKLSQVSTFTEKLKPKSKSVTKSKKKAAETKTNSKSVSKKDSTIKDHEMLFPDSKKPKKGKKDKKALLTNEVDKNDLDLEPQTNPRKQDSSSFDLKVEPQIEKELQERIS